MGNASWLLKSDTGTACVDDMGITPAGSAAPAPTPNRESVKLSRRLRSGQVAFLLLILLSLANVMLNIFSVTTIFPFSIHSASFAVDMGHYLADETGFEVLISGGIGLALAIIGTYALLYMLSRRHTWPVWTAFALIVIDTMLLGAFAVMIQDLETYIIDIVFHFLMIWSLMSFGLSRQLLSEQTGGTPRSARAARAM